MFRNSIAATALILFVHTQIAAAAAPAAIKAHGEGHTFAVGPFEFAGAAVIEFNGVAHDVEAHTILLDFQELPNGVIIAQTSHTFTFENGDTVVTHDYARMFPTAQPGLYEIRSELAIVSGSGQFEGARGFLRGSDDATIDFVAFEAIWSFDGVITTR
jgi:hypothetical protein